MERKPNSAFRAIMARRENVLTMAEDLDRHLEECIKRVRSQNVNVDSIILGERLYIILLESCILKKLDAIDKLRAKGGFLDRIFPELHARFTIDTLTRKNRLFERVGAERFPIRMNLNFPPNSVNVVTY